MQGTIEPGRSRPVGIVGCGSIGTAFALVFAAGGYTVRVHDTDAARLDAARNVLLARLSELADHGLLGEQVDAVAGRVSFERNLAAALADAQYVQECVPEDLATKQQVLSAIDAAIPADAVVASSASAVPASRSASHIPGRSRCLVCHPGNPPFLIRVIEVVPAPFTDPNTIEKAVAFLSSCGLKPVLVRKELEGFAFNRLQGAMLREAYCLVRDGVVTVDEIDQLVRDGLGLRWSFMGPFETCDLNTRGGLASHAIKMGPAYERMGAERGQHDPWTPDLVDRVVSERRALLPLDEWEERNAWRDRRLMALIRHRQQLTDEEAGGA